MGTSILPPSPSTFSRCDTCLSHNNFSSHHYTTSADLQTRESNSAIPMTFLSSVKRKLTRRSPSPPTKAISPLPMGTHLASQIPQSAPRSAPDPPPYSITNPNPTTTTTYSALTPTTTIAPTTQAEDPHAFLSTFDTIFLIDDSSSMIGARWTSAAHAVATIAPICTQHDRDGIDIHFLNAPQQPYHSNVRDAATVNEIFSSVVPYGGTPTGQKLDVILREYVRRYEKSVRRKGRGSPDLVNGRCKARAVVKPLNIIVITDGVPTDDVESPLVWAARRLDKTEAPAWQVGVQFFQVGDDECAAEALRGLDDGLSEIAGGEVRDIVDTVPFDGRMKGEGRAMAYGGGSGELTAEGILKVVLGAVNRRLDRRDQGTHF
ncbi:hypothetical protein B9Z65_3410 [Elsinoe australis]|uniref:VWFA domain-containing protein n=1 Tax=Elsinoe australis TaxID=40998 RepID=A0A2P7ZYB4_9PEZI|nr:hypothetical protein B9Z65_3410 [Elsinoe australis]